ncbi:nucleoside hydrolase [Candidatus Woesearchaeota archaeon]|nr:nucleoside hydrolase [Candidatus Woesearchaeota archaeon]
MKPLIIDTDIGVDVDDAFALAYAVKSGLDVQLITTVYGDTELRAKIATYLVQDLLQADIPIAAGLEKPLKHKLVFPLAGHEKLAIPSGYAPSINANGIEALASTIRSSPGIEIACIGPLTNIATLLSTSPDLASNIGHLYIMGNATICGCGEYHLNFRAHNFKVDPEAVDVVFASSIPKTLITTPIAKQSLITPEDIRSWRGNSVGNYLADTAEHWLAFSKYDCAFLYDPLVIHHTFDYDITAKSSYHLLAITTSAAPHFADLFLRVIRR